MAQAEVQTLDRQAVFAGVDWGGAFHQLCVLNGDGTLVVSQRIIHDVAGLATLTELLAAVDGPVLLAIERPRGCWWSSCRRCRW